MARIDRAQLPDRSVMRWAARQSGARDMLLALKERGYLDIMQAQRRDRRERVARTAIVQAMLDDKTNVAKFMREDKIYLYDWEYDSKGNPVKCKAKFCL